eukprot:CAMPEP_0174379930 /NCGR_PEP_ID=MMETSP0811_2-20130205/123033_1 /TAXON_ID=73025 ORGANISM="Eutreptiella gymnastica-like, Strain CCMP1594" /NCGR_SAMPLE_ID=MMETSP0811_2 /ASSEMBLY_ACC=CAM_ASM_000667 /LENGTH=141 /DNA_ID=CAMNT_0015532619 /DNA_START=399 /DNA_END=824 /DNA_ORIENTATION=-
MTLRVSPVVYAQWAITQASDLIKLDPGPDLCRKQNAAGVTPTCKMQGPVISIVSGQRLGASSRDSGCGQGVSWYWSALILVPEIFSSAITNKVSPCCLRPGPPKKELGVWAGLFQDCQSQRTHGDGIIEHGVGTDAEKVSM